MPSLFSVGTRHTCGTKPIHIKIIRAGEMAQQKKGGGKKKFKYIKIWARIVAPGTPLLQGRRNDI
jgi:3-methyladenine DNA glycosylase/8-oxoguanine DNA glycosylase